MTALAQADRWSCPTCGVTEVPNPGTPAAQQRHAHENAVERLMLKIETAA